MSAGEATGWLAAALTLLTFSMRSMFALRLVAVAANISFITYGTIVSLEPVLVLHLLLFPCNLFRLRQLFVARRAGAEVDAGISTVCGLPFADAGSNATSRDAAARDWLIVSTAHDAARVCDAVRAAGLEDGQR